MNFFVFLWYIIYNIIILYYIIIKYIAWAWPNQLGWTWSGIVRLISGPSNLALFFSFYWAVPDPTIQAGPKQIQPNSVGLGRLATQQALIFLLGGLDPAQSYGLGLNGSNPRPTWLLARPSYHVIILSAACRMNSTYSGHEREGARKGRGRRRRGKLPGLDALAMRRRFDWWLWRRWWRG